MGFYDKPELAQQIFCFFRALDFDDSGGMAELHLHAAIISSPADRDKRRMRRTSRRNEFASGEGEPFFKGCEDAVELRFIAGVQQESHTRS
jgi:hypothetical protein